MQTAVETKITTTTTHKIPCTTLNGRVKDREIKWSIGLDWIKAVKHRLDTGSFQIKKLKYKLLE